MAENTEDMIWLFDSVTQFLKGPEWAVPVWDFIDDNCIVFDSEDENKLEYSNIFNVFREMVESLLDIHLSNMGVSSEQFAELCATFGSTDVGKEVLEQILAVDDFISFKCMMVKRNMELEVETLKGLQELQEKLEAGLSPEDPQEANADDDYEAQLQAALELSLKESIAPPVHDAEVMAAEETQEEKDVKLAIALSLAVDAADPEPVAPPPTSTPKPVAPAQPAAPPPRLAPAAAPPAQAHRMAPVKAPLGTLAPIPRMSAAPEKPEQVQAKEAVYNAQIKAQEAREKALAEMAQQPPRNPGPQGATADEIRARAEHLKKQRDLILAQKKKQREASAPVQAPIGNAMPPPAMTQSAGYSAPEQSLTRNQELTQALASSMKAQLKGEDAATLDLQNRMAKSQQKDELERAKENLLREADEIRRF